MASGKRLKQQRESLARFLNYILGNRPDEFGLVPDNDGYVPLKELLQALSEEDGWRSVRKGDIAELLREPDASGLEVKDNLIRAAPSATLLAPRPAEPAPAPNLLYYAARRKGYPVILQEGLKPLGSRPYVILAATPEMALRLGRRRDPEPVSLTILAERAENRGVKFRRFLEHLYLVDSLAPDLFSGPPLPKEKPEKEKKEKTEDKSSFTPGSFKVEAEYIFKVGPDKDKDRKDKKKRGDAPDWKRAARKERRKRGDEF